jgi:signal transduction histidine kinase
MLHYHDNGHGMDEAVRAQIFEPFFTTRRGQGGSGLGLHVVYNLVTQLLKGSIRVESAPGDGALFEIFLPANLTSTG